MHRQTSSITNEKEANSKQGSRPRLNKITKISEISKYQQSNTKRASTSRDTRKHNFN